MHPYRYETVLRPGDVAVAKHVLLSQLGNIDLRKKHAVSVIWKNDEMKASTGSNTFAIRFQGLYGSLNLHKIVESILESVTVIDSDVTLTMLRKAYAYVVENGERDADPCPICFGSYMPIYQLVKQDYRLVAFNRENIAYLSVKRVSTDKVVFGVAINPQRALSYDYKSGDCEGIAELCEVSDNTILYDANWLMSRLRQHAKTDAELLEEIVRIANTTIYNNRFSVADLIEVCRNDLGM